MNTSVILRPWAGNTHYFYRKRIFNTNEMDFAVWERMTSIGHNVGHLRWHSDHTNTTFATKEEAMICMDAFLISKGYILLDQERLEKISLLV